MTKTLTLNDLENMFGQISKLWDKTLPELRILNKSLYNLISLKKKLEEKHLTTQETIAAIMKMHGAEEDEQGVLRLPPEQIKEANQEFEDLANQTVEITYEPILIKEENSIPSVIMEIFYDFIVVE